MQFTRIAHCHQRQVPAEDQETRVVSQAPVRVCLGESRRTYNEQAADMTNAMRNRDIPLHHRFARRHSEADTRRDRERQKASG